MSEELKIRELLKQYDKFIQTSAADITKSIKGKWFFYYVDDKSGDLYNVIEFKTADELEKIILCEIADDLNSSIEMGIENLNEELNEKNISYSYCEFGNAINRLANSLNTIQKEFNI